MSTGFLYRVVRWLLHAALGFYFRRIERFHVERVPAQGPVLFVSNHPNSLTDAFVIGAAVSRKVHFVATVRVFRFRAVAWLLSRCGVIPINRVQDNPRAMRSVLETFEACWRVFERGEAVAIFPEGITHDDPQLKTVKTGPARMAIEAEERHDGALGLYIMPVGLTYSAKERYRSDVLVHFGQPIRVRDYLAGPAAAAPVESPAGEHTVEAREPGPAPAPRPAHRREAIQQLNAEIERRLQALIVHLPELERARVVAAVARLYLERLRLGNLIIQEPLSPRAEELLLTKAIADAVDYVYREDPERAQRFVRKLDRYEKWLARLRVPDEAVEQFGRSSRWGWRSFGWGLLAVLGAPVALYGQLHRFLPLAIVRWSVRRFATVNEMKARISTIAILSGMASFSLFYGALIWSCYWLFDWRVATAYGMSLPLAGLVAHGYFREAERLITGVRNSMRLVRLRLGGRRLIELRAELIAEAEAARADYRRTLVVSPDP